MELRKRKQIPQRKNGINDKGEIKDWKWLKDYQFAIKVIYKNVEST